MTGTKAIVIQDSAQALLEAGIDPSEITRINGHYTRLRTLAKPRHRNGYAFMHEDGSICVGNFEEYCPQKVIIPDPSSKYQSKTDYRLKTAYYRVRRAQAELEKDRVFQTKYKLAFNIWRQSSSLNHSDLHSYLRRKQVMADVTTIREITASRLREIMGYSPFTGRILVFPLKFEDRVASLQFVSESGDKRFLKDARKSECFWQTHRCENPKVIAISEGMITVLSVIEHSQSEMLGISALDAGNLPKVAKGLPNRWPDVEQYIIYADSDETGQASAEDAVLVLKRKGCNVEIRSPEFSEKDIKLFQEITGTDKVPTDWNDYYVIHDALDSKQEK